MVNNLSMLEVESASFKYKLSDLKFKCLQDLEYIEEYHELNGASHELMKSINKLQDQLEFIKENDRASLIEQLEDANKGKPLNNLHQLMLE